ncbi:MAG: hypothetical protein A2275_08980 [Bacteroidetes bacterium RIFOXYA12_FULL_35_11]|nr:MAG: hypothetical protein A2X01_06105 [Bacteroidetes bacterium GWF2_35_48]OFY82934.1 MAG: hypothetical protein A2275_08980 [Bacteroidetes bacterium RIFOXYA12_FULL_35_11]OFY95272.1 MAG: hypothetical protein A2309_03110 [Bacteroidetes bacterium RIFOXYB2_FULL_35_7]OFZ01888.1 MAG: hypothetical protein A2491_02440 [Bacteroidetes bacterium RIFOXYC12_FULL_35_7]HBX52754.1 hypothetical protein [Bacteroidales bacterium]
MLKPIFIIPLILSFFTIPFLKKKEVLPPGCVKIEENVFIDQTEVRNVDYREFMHWLKRKHGERSDEYQTMLPDTNLWVIFKAHKISYFRSGAYHFYPVVGVSYDQAVAYCKWRSDRVNEYFYLNENKFSFKVLDTLKIENVPRIFEYRLPTRKEWEQVAKTEYDPKELKKIERKKLETGQFFDPNRTKRSDVKVVIAKCGVFPPNALQVFEIFGNVAEMIDEKGIAKGGSWKHPKEECTVEKDFTYDIPNNWLGFRCACNKVGL